MYFAKKVYVPVYKQVHARLTHLSTQPTAHVLDDHSLLRLTITAPERTLPDHASFA